MKNKSNSKTAVVIFLRFPRPGHVKSRLAASLGSKTATKFYRLCSERLFNELKRIKRNCKMYIFYSDESDEKDIQEWAGSEFSYRFQAKGNIGNRLVHAFSYLLGKGMDKVIIMASDTPDISVDTVEEAIDNLENHDIVIGPALDGGYYLIGLKRFDIDLFKNIAWSTDIVLKQTMKIIEKKGLTVYKLEVLRDIDTLDDLSMWLETTNNRDNPVLKYAESLHL